MEQKLQSPTELADEVFELVRAMSIFSGRRALVHELLVTAFYASLESEESRPCTFSIVVLDDQLLAGPANRHYWRPMPFAQASEFSVASLVKLSPASDPEQTHVAVVVEGDKLWIRGLVRANREGERFARGEREEVQGIDGSFLIVQARGPGVIDVRDNKSRIALLSRGDRLERAVDLFSEGWLYERLLHDASAAGVSDSLYSSLVRSILYRIAQQGTGGVLIMAAETPLHVEAEYTLEKPSEALIDGLRFAEQGFAEQEADSVSALVEVARGPGSTLDRDADLVTRRAVDAHLFRGDIASFAADLAAMDGAVLVDCRARILGFGVKITSSDPVSVPARLALTSDASELDASPLPKLGTRHNSAARFCYHNPGSIAFVISQDGVVSCMIRYEDRDHVLVWRPIALEWHVVITPEQR